MCISAVLHGKGKNTSPSVLISCSLICGVRPVALTTAECGEYFMKGGGGEVVRQTLTW